ncbi:MAG: LysM peptidoglycan-binding domain-containing M23 family metallopeptidase [Chloroflexota bacterium]
MPRQSERARLRLLAPLAAVAVVPLVVLSGVAGTISAKPPSTPGPVPLEAFRPVVLPRESDPPTSRAISPRVPDVGWAEPTARPSATPQPTAPAGPEHIVRSGDTLWQIAAWHRADLGRILRWNPDIDPRRLVAGQRILVPGGEPMPTPAPTPKAKTGGGTPPERSGVHLWPVPVRGTITTRFSAAHAGIDIAAPAGTAVRAIAPGTVTWASWKNNGGGYVVVIRHPDGMVSTYNHNREVSVRVGQDVAAGEQIAAVGATGWATGPHLDLRIEMGGEFIDPLRLDWTR